MDVQSLFEPILKIAMIFLRAGSLWMFFPIFSQGGIPGNVRLFGGIAFSAALLPLAGPKLPTWSVVAPPDMATMAGFIAREFLVGAGMALAVRWIYASITGASHWVGTQMGFSAGGLLDPEFQASDTSWSEFNQWVATILFFSCGGHLFLIQALATSYSFDLSQFSQTFFDGSQHGAFWIEMGRAFFIWMLKLSGPMVVVLLILQAALGVLSKFVPQINVWSVSIPVTIGAGVLVFSILSPLYGDALGELFKYEIQAQTLWMRAIGGR